MMDDTTPTPENDTDEALSASIDGELPPAEHDPTEELPARRAELSAARDALRDAPVKPLDEVTRRRLVSRALEESAAPVRRGWVERVPWRAVAAVVAVVVIGGGVALALQDNGGSSRSTSTASRSKSTPESAAGSTTRSDSDTSITGQPPSAAAGSTPTPLNGLGDIGDTKGLAARVRAAMQSWSAREAAGRRYSAADITAINALNSCPSTLNALRTPTQYVSAIGGGTVDGQPAAVAVTTDKAGHEQAIVVTLDGCKARRPIPL